MRKIKWTYWLCLLVAGLTFSACDDDDDDGGGVTPVENSIIDVATEQGDLTSFIAAVEAAGLTEALEADGDMTVFAPTDAAFTELANTLGISVDDLLTEDNSDVLNRVLSHHVIGTEAIGSDEISDGDTESTLANTLLTFTVGDNITIGNTLLDSALIDPADLDADNGVLHVINHVLLPGTIGDMITVDVNYVDVIPDADFDSLVTAFALAEVGDELFVDDGTTKYTVFAPTNAAFEAALDTTLSSLDTDTLALVLNYHIVEGEFLAADLMDGDTLVAVNGDSLYITVDGESVFINEAQVTMADVQTSNGVIHVIDMVLVPEFDEEEPETIAAIVAGDENFSALDSALAFAGLTETFQGEGAYTVFAPTNAAFDALIADLPEYNSLEELLVEGNEDLVTGILQYHVVSDSLIDSSTIEDGNTATTLLGQDLTFNVDSESGAITIANPEGSTDATIDPADVEASNGVIHVIDQVLLPPSEEN
ncbi:fasciclin domain-containing protein [Limibacter armeniacum]|uniref:fasciclin domain-containing protein n=1 Tax=Limibacter armeniacum TaxID=466084 RepID=UPI002FE53594